MSFPPLFVLSSTLLPKRIVYHAWLVSTVVYIILFLFLLNLLPLEIIIYIFNDKIYQCFLVTMMICYIQTITGSFQSMILLFSHNNTAVHQHILITWNHGDRIFPPVNVYKPHLIRKLICNIYIYIQLDIYIISINQNKIIRYSDINTYIYAMLSVSFSLVASVPLLAMNQQLAFYPLQALLYKFQLIQCVSMRNSIYIYHVTL